MAEYFHLAVAWDWEFDRDFISILEEEVHGHDVSFFSISHHNTHECTRKIQRGELAFGTFLDRAGDANEHFLAVSRAIRKSASYYINPPEATIHANDKATMHLEFLSAGIPVPFSIIISPYNKKKELELKLGDIARLGRPFIIKPANTTGGGIGVITGAETLKDVLESRQHHKNDKYLLQEKVHPVMMGSMKGWFRVFYVFGLIVPSWWDDETHRYSTIESPELERFALHPLADIAKSIHDVCLLDFFSTEIALTADDRYVVVDYVNDICDMRLQSRFIDGVPDSIVRTIALRIARALPAIASPRQDNRESGS
jgi:hypothetical protein